MGNISIKNIFWIIILGLAVLFLMRNDWRHKYLQFERLTNRISFAFQNQFAGVLFSDEHILIPIEFKKQEHAVTCETASLRMALSFLGVDVSEDELLSKLDFDTKDPVTTDKVWGDPSKGFVGNIDGSIFLGTGYGVYEQPIARLAFNYRQSAIMQKTDLEQVLQTTKEGHPVIVWGLLQSKNPIRWKTTEGITVTAFGGEHTRVVMGYGGEISNPTYIVLMDPIYGKIRMSTNKFLSDWKILDNRAVAIF